MKFGIPTQKNIYTRGMSGHKPKVPVDYKRLKKQAKSKMSKEAWAYVAGGAGAETTMASNRNAFNNYRFKAGMMKASSDIDMRISLFGRTYDSPLMIAPVGVLEMAHPNGDLAVARACKTQKVPMVFSNQSSYSMEDCAQEMGDCPRWFQLYWSKSDALVQSFISRAEECGCEAIAVTLDTTSLGWRPRDLDLGFLPFLRGMGLAQYTSDPVFQSIVKENMKQPDVSQTRPSINFQSIRNIIGLCRRYPGSFISNLTTGRAVTAVKTFIDIYMRPELRWEDLERLRDMTSLPIMVKGIQRVEDANRAFDSGVDGIIVSNHGGRQIDGGIGALECLDKILLAHTPDKTILFDSGIRSGADVIKALALGADAVLIGRPYVYGLAVNGQEGVESVLRYFLAEIELQLSLMGIDRLERLDRSVFK